ncbi:helix-turn-helix domain-containing protein [Streptomyces sp. NBC_00019]|uniref:helix-turn-helix domain-containing protein n=1 Tax=Streptomyces sp. NBC_00019 TaxID=2975623 RepID=UPI002F910941
MADVLTTDPPAWHHYDNGARAVQAGSGLWAMSHNSSGQHIDCVNGTRHVSQRPWNSPHGGAFGVLRETDTTQEDAMPAHRALNAKQEREVRTLYAHGLSSTELAQRYSVTHKTILKAIPQSERRVPGGIPLRQDLPMHEIVPRYQSGESAAALADEYGVSATTLKTRLQDAGAMSPLARISTPEGNRALVQEYENGATLDSLSARHGPSRLTIKRLLEENGVTIRRRGPRSSRNR